MTQKVCVSFYFALAGMYLCTLMYLYTVLCSGLCQLCNSEKFWEHTVRSRCAEFTSDMEGIANAMGWRRTFFTFFHASGSKEQQWSNWTGLWLSWNNCNTNAITVYGWPVFILHFVKQETVFWKKNGLHCNYIGLRVPNILQNKLIFWCVATFLLNFGLQLLPVFNR